MNPSRDSNMLDSFSARARKFGAIHVSSSTKSFANNLSSTVDLIQLDDFAMPVTIDTHYSGSAWVCSPRVTYVNCAEEEAGRYLPSWIMPACRAMSVAMGAFLDHAEIDRAVAINNWLLSTNLYPPLTETPIDALIQHAHQRWPDHAIWFRSLNDIDNVDWIEALKVRGFKLIASRQVYLYDNIQLLASRHSNLKFDLAQLKRTSLHRSRNDEIGIADYARIAQLYQWLYIDKYSNFNPQYTEEFLRCWHQADLLEFDGFRDERGDLQCVVGLFRQGNTNTAPIVGYNTALPQKTGLYRLLTACAYETTMSRGFRLNFSAGAAEFKRLRGGRAALEYSAVYANHRPLRTRRAINTLSQLTLKLGVPFIRRYQL